MKEEAEVPRFEGDIEDIWDDIGAPSTETAMLRVAMKYPGIDPYSIADGCVRMSAVDRWCNNLIREGLIRGWEEDDGSIWIWATDKAEGFFA